MEGGTLHPKRAPEEPVPLPGGPGWSKMALQVRGMIPGWSGFPSIEYDFPDPRGTQPAMENQLTSGRTFLDWNNFSPQQPQNTTTRTIYAMGLSG